jgi:GTP-binding protein HflX
MVSAVRGKYTQGERSAAGDRSAVHFTAAEIRKRNHLAETKRETLRVKNQRAILAAVLDPSEKNDSADPLWEIRGLVETAGVEVVGELTQNRRTPDPATLMGKGKLEELKVMAQALDAQLVVFDNQLSPSQGRNIEKALDTVIVDRSEVILDIFASRARTWQAKLQVELAQLLYFRPRLTRLWNHLERIEGGVGAGRGPGEKQLETDRRLVDKRIDELRRKLSSVEKHRSRMVEQRREHKTVSLVGYTNAGKSTLMNALAEADVYAADQLFATLDTRTRRWTVPHWGDVLLSDTVGFIQRLPHHLVESFKSTLEEARYADLLLHVVDASHPEAEKQIETVYEVLDEIGVTHDNVILVLNKCDAVEDRSIVDVLRIENADAVTVSAKTGEGIDRLSAMVADRLGDGAAEVRIEAHAGDGKLHSFLQRHAEVLSTDYVDSQAIYACRIPRQLLHKLNEFDAQIETLTTGPGSDVGFDAEPIEA